jgi:hemoglobin-like flavoprotein
MGPSKEDLASRFYRQLLTRDPSLQDLLPGERDAREAGFTKGLTEIVDSMSNFPELVAHTRQLGECLAQHGVRVSHYPTGRAALMAALEDVLGDRLDPGTREAWTMASNLVAECMMAGASRR